MLDKSRTRVLRIIRLPHELQCSGGPKTSEQLHKQCETTRRFLPFITTVYFEKVCLLAPAANDEWQFERGTRYYLTVFGAVMPLWTTSDITTVVS